MFRLIVNNNILDVEKDTYFELKKSTFISGKPNFNTEYSSNIQLPNTAHNMRVFNSHVILGGTDKVFKCIAFFGTMTFEAQIQLVSFDSKKITIFLVRKKTTLTILEGVSMDDVLKESGRGWVGDDASPTDDFMLNSFNIHPSDLEIYDFQNVLNDTYYGSLVDFSNYPHTMDIVPDNKMGGGMTIFSSKNITYTHDSMQPPSTWIFSETWDKDIFRLEIDIPVRGWVAIDDEVMKTRLWVNAVAVGGTTGATVKIGIRGDDGSIQHDDFYLFADSIQNESLEFTLKKGVRYEMMTPQFIGAPIDEVNFRVQFWTVTSTTNTLTNQPQLGRWHSIGWASTLLSDFLTDIAFENGQYLEAGEDGRLIFVDMPSLEAGSIVDLSANFKAVRSVSTKNNILTAQNNLIQYSKNLDLEEDFVNIKSSSERLDLTQKDTAVFRRLKISKERVDYPFDGTETAEYVRVIGGGSLKDSIPRFQIFADAHGLPRLYEIEFSNLYNVPSGVVYIDKLNGLFIPTETIETTKNKTIIKLLRLQQ